MPEDSTELKIQVRINAETKQLEIVQTGITKLGEQTQKYNTQQKNQTGTTNQSSSAFKALGSALGINVMEFTTVAGAAAALGKVFKDSLAEEEKEITRQRVLTGLLKGLGLNYGKLKESIDTTLKSLRAQTRFTSDETYEAFIKTLKITGDVNTAYKLLKISMDVAIGTGKTQEEVMATFNTALASGARGTIVLAREFGKLGAQGKTAAEIITNLGKSYDNARVSETGLAKETTGLKELYEAMTQGIGKQLMPVMGGFITLGKALLFAVLTPLNFIIASIKTSVASLILPLGVLLGLLTNGIAGAKEVIKGYGEDVKKNFGEAADATSKGWAAMFDSTAKMSKETIKAIEDAQIKAIRNVEETGTKAAKAAEEAAKAAKKATEEAKQKAEAMVSSLAGEFDTAFKTIAEAGNLSKQTMDTVFEGIYKSFRDMLIKMVAELVARQAIIGILSMLSGGGVGVAGQLLAGLTGAKGAFDTGGTAPRDGMYFLKQGEHAAMPGQAGNNNSGGGKEVHIHYDIKAFDLRQIDQNTINRLSRQLTPHIKKELDL
jgi:hypothetical protein